MPCHQWPDPCTVGIIGYEPVLSGVDGCCVLQDSLQRATSQPLCPLLKQQASETFASSSVVRRPTSRQSKYPANNFPFSSNVFSLLSIHPRHALPSPLLQLPQTATNCALHRPAINPVLFLLLTRAAYSLLCVLFVVVDRQSSQNLSLHHAFIFRRPPLDHLDG
jgi:hypothetical protein